MYRLHMLRNGTVEAEGQAELGGGWVPRLWQGTFSRGCRGALACALSCDARLCMTRPCWCMQQALNELTSAMIASMD